MKARVIWLVFKLHFGAWILALWYAAYQSDEVRVSLLKSINVIMGG